MKNNLYRKGFIVPVLLGVVVLLVIGGVIYFYKTKKVESPVVVNESEEVGLDNQQEVAPIDTTVQNSNTKSFKLGTLEFSYPSILTLSKTGETTSLDHSIPYRHQFGCDFKGDTVTMLNDVNDFSASFKILSKDLLSSVKLSIGDSSLTQAIMGESSYKVGSLVGYKIQRGVEGCGTFEYYFPISANETLNISQGMHAQTLGQMGGPTTLDKTSGFITYTQEEQIFKDILSSVTGLPNQKTISIKLYFPNSVIDKGFLDCNIVRPTTRTIPYTLATGEASLRELIKGPTAQELSQGFQTQIDSNTTIKSLSIKDGTAYVKFSKDIQNKNLGLCAGQFIVAQVRETLLQFPTIKKVDFSVEGLVGDFIQP